MFPLRWVITFLLVLIVLRLVMRFLTGLFQGLQGAPRSRAAGRRASSTQPTAVPLVRDPVCGTYVVPSRAMTISTKGTTYYFCSDACRQKFEREPSHARPA
jgi:YHS domain-containing protein